MRGFGYSLLVLSLLIFSCEKENKDNNQDFELQCDEFIIENASRYNNEDGVGIVGIDTVVLSGDCLEVTIAASGCDGSTWQVDLVDSEAIMESFPLQRVAKIILVENNEACLAIPSRTFSFDLQPIQESLETSLVLNIDGWDEAILYEY